MSDDPIYIVDLFAGAGGLSTGIANAVRNLGMVPGEDVHLVAINHNEDAIATHRANHPWAEHYDAKIEALHPPDVAPPEQTTVLAGGPSCTHFSGARGGQPVNEQERASPWHMLRWIELLRPKHIVIENVGHLRSWGPVEDGVPSRDGSIFERYVGMLQALGYTVIQDEQGRYGVKLRAANFGDPTTRERLFVLASRTKLPTAPDPTHSDDSTDGLEDWVPASEILDLSNHGESMFKRSQPLKSTTNQRIARGLRDYCDDRLEPYAAVIETLDQADIRALQDDVVAVEDLPDELEDRDEPFLVRGEVPLVEDDGAVRMVMGQHGGAIPRDAEAEPVPTIASRGAIHYIEANAFVLPRNGYQGDDDSNPAYLPGDRPFHCVTAKNHDGRLFTPFIVQYNGKPEFSAWPIDEPLRTLSTRARFALVDPEVFPWGIDLRYRMLDPPETKRAQGFPADYELVGDTKKSRRKQIGNAVPVNMATAIVEHILAAETASLSSFGAGISRDPDVEIPSFEEVTATDD